MIQEIYGKKSVIVWQEETEALESPIVVTAYSNLLELSQSGNSISILPSHLGELIKAMRNMNKEIE